MSSFAGEITKLQVSGELRDKKQSLFRGLEIALLSYSLFGSTLVLLSHAAFFLGRRIHQSKRSLLFHHHLSPCSVWLREGRAEVAHSSGRTQALQSQC